MARQAQLSGIQQWYDYDDSDDETTVDKHKGIKVKKIVQLND